MKRTAAAIGIALALLPAGSALAAESATLVDGSSAEGLTSEQIDVLNDYLEDSSASGSAMISVKGNLASLATSSRRAQYYRGSALMWTRDNVDFSYTGTRVSSSSGFQQRGYIFPNIARNLGITRTNTTTTNHRWRASNRIGAGVVTPWGDVSVYSSDFTHRLSVNANGSWSAWSD